MVSLPWRLMKYEPTKGVDQLQKSRGMAILSMISKMEDIIDYLRKTQLGSYFLIEGKTCNCSNGWDETIVTKCQICAKPIVPN